MTFTPVERMTTAAGMNVAEPKKDAGDVTGTTWRAARPGID